MSLTDEKLAGNGFSWRKQANAHRTRQCPFGSLVLINAVPGSCDCFREADISVLIVVADNARFQGVAFYLYTVGLE